MIETVLILASSGLMIVSTAKLFHLWWTAPADPVPEKRDASAAIAASRLASASLYDRYRTSTAVEGLPASSLGEDSRRTAHARPLEHQG